MRARLLDVVSQKFVELLESQQSESSVKEGHSRETESVGSSKTVIIWLHHLLATSKRKLAIHPSISADLISGITKPGYPGVMLFTGLQHAVDDHVAELKGLNWAGFFRLGTKKTTSGILSTREVRKGLLKWKQWRRWCDESQRDDTSISSKQWASSDEPQARRGDPELLALRRYE